MTKTGNIHTDVANLYYDQIGTGLAALQAEMADLVEQVRVKQLAINAAIPADARARQFEFLQDLVAYLSGLGKSNAATMAGFFVAAVVSKDPATILASMDAYLAAGGQ